MKVNPTAPSRIPKAIKDAVERGTNTTGKAKINLGAKPTVGKMVGDAAPRNPGQPSGPRPTVGKMAPEQTPRKPVYGKDAVERGTNTTGGGKPNLGAKPSVGKRAPEQTPRDPGKFPAKPSVGKRAPEQTPKVPFKPGTDPVPGPGKRPAKPAATPTVYRAKKGDGLWQVAEKTVPAGVSTSAWWAKIKKLNSTNGKVNRTYTNTGVKLPKA